MKRVYAYRENFEVTVELEPVFEGFGSIKLLPPRGFISIVHVRMVGATRPMIVPIRLTADNQRPFATEADALMAGFSAGQRVIDDILTQ